MTLEMQTFGAAVVALLKIEAFTSVLHTVEEVESGRLMKMS